MDLIRVLLFWGIIVFAWIISNRVGVGLLKKSKNFWLSLVISIAVSLVVIIPSGYYWYLTEPDSIGKGLSVFVYQTSFVLICLLNIVLLWKFFKKSQTR
ncbi:hypothetical protein GH741_03740 [Aquibacillus halophilus]|uniref:Uncharacterized protein n=1 Tax=Aquibacillus halophilus TaxID=930132 RepID=A0A6A8D7Q8_9BACI|nr:hypothetical protein [Aquibacillus halophilus]MRH41783.1 hypothetical protein [Aquibacillus halophilus]